MSILSNDEMCVCVSGSENESVLLASSAIHLFDERESPISAGILRQRKIFGRMLRFWGTMYI